MTTLAPIYGSGMRLGTFIMWREDGEFTDDDLVLVELATTVIGVQLSILNLNKWKKISVKTPWQLWLLTHFHIQK